MGHLAATSVVLFKCENLMAEPHETDAIRCLPGGTGSPPGGCRPASGAPPCAACPTLHGGACQRLGAALSPPGPPTHTPGRKSSPQEVRATPSDADALGRGHTLRGGRLPSRPEAPSCLCSRPPSLCTPRGSRDPQSAQYNRGSVRSCLIIFSPKTLPGVPLYDSPREKTAPPGPPLPLRKQSLVSCPGPTRPPLTREPHSEQQLTPGRPGPAAAHKPPPEAPSAPHSSKSTCSALAALPSPHGARPLSRPPTQGLLRRGSRLHLRAQPLPEKSANRPGRPSTARRRG